MIVIRAFYLIMERCCRSFIKQKKCCNSSVFAIKNYPLESMGCSSSSSAATSTTMSSKPTIIFVLGAPGAGKGTQCDKIVQVWRGRQESIGCLTVCLVLRRALATHISRPAIFFALSGAARNSKRKTKRRRKKAEQESAR